MKLLVLVVFISLITPLKAQTCTTGGTSPECVLCPNGVGVVSGDTFGAEIATSCVAGTITLGTNSPNCPITVGSPTSPSPVAIYHGSFDVYSPVINLGTATPSPGSITIGNGVRSVTVAPATTTTVNIGSGASTGDINIGADSSVSPTTQILELGRYSNTVNLGRNAVTSINIGIATSGTISIGSSTATIQIAPATSSSVTIASGASTGSITIGSNSPVAPTTQTVTIGQYSNTIEIGNNAVTSINVGASSTGSINIGNTGLSGNLNFYHGTFAVFSPTINIGTATPNSGTITVGNPTRPVTIAPVTTAAVNIAAGASTGTVTIGRDSSTPTAQIINLGVASPTINIATSAIAPSTINVGTTGIGTFNLNTGTINIGTSTPTTGAITIGNPTRAVTIAPATTAAVSIAAGASTGDITIGRNAPTPTTQTVNLATHSPTINLGTSGTYINIGGSASGYILLGTGVTSPTAYIEIGRSSNELSQGSDFYLANRNSNVYFARNVNNLYIASNGPNPTPGYPAAGPVTLGWQTPSPSPAGNTGYAFNTLSISGKYHDFYSSFCNAPTTTGTIICNVPTPTPVPAGLSGQSYNVPSAAAPTTSGYDTTNGYYYPQTPGIYLLCYNFLTASANTVTEAIYERTASPTPSVTLVANAFVATSSNQASACGMQFVASPVPSPNTRFYVRVPSGSISPSVQDKRFSIARIG